MRKYRFEKKFSSNWQSKVCVKENGICSVERLGWGAHYENIFNYFEYFAHEYFIFFVCTCVLCVSSKNISITSSLFNFYIFIYLIVVQLLKFIFCEWFYDRDFIASNFWISTWNSVFWSLQIASESNLYTNISPFSHYKFIPKISVTFQQLDSHYFVFTGKIGIISIKD